MRYIFTFSLYFSLQKSFFQQKNIFIIKLFFHIKTYFSGNNVYFVKNKKENFLNLVLQQMNNHTRDICEKFVYKYSETIEHVKIRFFFK